MSGVALVHTETDFAPECSVVFGGGRLRGDGLVDLRRIELRFSGAHFTRTGPHDDNVGVESIGYRIEDEYEGPGEDYLDCRARRWRETGFAPSPGFYVAKESDWLDSISPNRALRHYVVDGRGGYAEVLAEKFAWRELLWTWGHRESLSDDYDVVGSGEGVE
jgi:hypothetical protein